MAPTASQRAWGHQAQTSWSVWPPPSCGGLPHLSSEFRRMSLDTLGQSERSLGSTHVCANDQGDPNVFDPIAPVWGGN